MPAILTELPIANVGTAQNTQVFWLAVSGDYPVYFKFKRVDYLLQNVLPSTANPGKAIFTLASWGAGDDIQVGGSIKIETPTYGIKTGKILSFTTAFLFPMLETDIDYIATETFDYTSSNGSINMLTGRSRHKVRFTAYDPATNDEYGSIWVSPDPNGNILVDVGGLMAKHIEDSPIPQPTVNASLPNASKPFRLYWYDTHDPDVKRMPQTFYAGHFANQLQNTYGENLAEHVCVLDDGGHLGKIMSAFEEPVYFEGFPFSLQTIIQGIDGASPNVFRVEEQLNSAGATLATVPTPLADTDYQKVHEIALDTTIAPTVDCINLSLDLNPTFAVDPTITGISLNSITDCNPNTGTYTAVFAVYYENRANPTELVTIKVGAEPFTAPLASTQSGGLIYVPNLPADGALQTVQAQLVSNPGFTFTETDLYTAPVPCQDCRIFTVTSIGTSNLDLVNQTFDWTFQMDYANAPAGNISVNGVQIAAPTPGTNAVVTLPLTSGTTVDLTLFFVADTSCNFSATEFITLPTTYVKRVKEELVASGPNSLPNLANTPRTGSAILLEYRGVTYTSIGASPDFNVVGNTVTWNNNVAQVDIQTGESVYVTYETLAAAAPGDNWVYEAKEIVSTNVIPGFLQFTVIANSLTMYYNGVAYQSFGADQALSIVGNSATWMNNQGVDLQPGDTVYFVYNTLVATGNEEAILEFDTITAQNVMPDGLVNQPQDTTDLILFYRGIGLFNFGGDATISLSSQIFTFNPAAAGFNIDAGDQTFQFYQKTV